MENTATLKATQEIKFVMMCHDMFLEYTLMFSITKICRQQLENKEAIVSSSHARVVHSQEVAIVRACIIYSCSISHPCNHVFSDRGNRTHHLYFITTVPCRLSFVTTDVTGNGGSNNELCRSEWATIHFKSITVLNVCLRNIYSVKYEITSLKAKFFA
jgi:hypothetical protein